MVFSLNYCQHYYIRDLINNGTFFFRVSKLSRPCSIRLHPPRFDFYTKADQSLSSSPKIIFVPQKVASHVHAYYGFVRELNVSG